MKGPWKKKLIERFGGSVRSLLSGFSRAGPDRDPHGNGIVFYKDLEAKQTTIFFAMEISPKRSGFTFEGAWSKSPTFPDFLPPLDPKEIAGEAEGRFRVGALMEEIEAMDHWWWIRTESEIDEVLDAGLDVLTATLVPFLESIGDSIPDIDPALEEQ